MTARNSSSRGSDTFDLHRHLLPFALTCTHIDTHAHIQVTFLKRGVFFVAPLGWGLSIKLQLKFEVSWVAIESYTATVMALWTMTVFSWHTYDAQLQCMVFWTMAIFSWYTHDARAQSIALWAMVITSWCTHDAQLQCMALWTMTIFSRYIHHLTPRKYTRLHSPSQKVMYKMVNKSSWGCSETGYFSLSIL